MDRPSGSSNEIKAPEENKRPRPEKKVQFQEGTKGESSDKSSGRLDKSSQSRSTDKVKLTPAAQREIKEIKQIIKAQEMDKRYSATTQGKKDLEDYKKRIRDLSAGKR